MDDLNCDTNHIREEKIKEILYLKLLESIQYKNDEFTEY